MADGRGKKHTSNPPSKSTPADRRKTENRVPGQKKPGPKPKKGK
jgi:hypothetical protein